MDYRKLNKATMKDHFPLPFIDQMLDRLAGHEYYCLLDGYSGYNRVCISPEDQEKLLSLVHLVLSPSEEFLVVYVEHLPHFRDA